MTLLTVNLTFKVFALKLCKLLKWPLRFVIMSKLIFFVRWPTTKINIFSSFKVIQWLYECLEKDNQQTRCPRPHHELKLKFSYFFGVTDVTGGRRGCSRNGHSASYDVGDWVDEAGLSCSNRAVQKNSEVFDVFIFWLVVHHILKILLIISDGKDYI